MESISRTVHEFAAPQRQAIEQVLGHPLRDDQQVTISVQPDIAAAPSASVPKWLNLYAGLTDKEVSNLESAILQRDPSTRIAD
jgi:hypothetical protein